MLTHIPKLTCFLFLFDKEAGTNCQCKLKNVILAQSEACNLNVTLHDWNAIRKISRVQDKLSKSALHKSEKVNSQVYNDQ